MWAQLPSLKAGVCGPWGFSEVCEGPSGDDYFLLAA